MFNHFWTYSFRFTLAGCFVRNELIAEFESLIKVFEMRSKSVENMYVSHEILYNSDSNVISYRFATIVLGIRGGNKINHSS